MDAEEAGAGAGAGPSETGRRSVGGVMSKTSKADYAVYTLGRPGQTKVVAIIDAKKHITPHSVAQVIGYYSAFEVSDKTLHTLLSQILGVLRGFDEVRCAGTTPNLYDKALHTLLSLISCVLRGFDEVRCA